VAFSGRALAPKDSTIELPNTPRASDVKDQFSVNRHRAYFRRRLAGWPESEWLSCKRIEDDLVI